MKNSLRLVVVLTLFCFGFIAGSAMTFVCKNINSESDKNTNTLIEAWELSGQKLDDVNQMNFGDYEYTAFGVDAYALDSNAEFCPVALARFKNFDIILNRDDRILYVGNLPDNFSISKLVDAIEKSYHKERDNN